MGTERRIFVTLMFGFLLISTVFAPHMILLLGSAPVAATSEVNSPSGLLTGRIFDKGIDKDGNGLFDYLQVNVEVTITTAGMYYLSAYGLKNGTTWPYSYAYVNDYRTVYLSATLQNVTMSFYGPTIEAYGQTNLSFVGSISINSADYYQSDYRQDLALSRPYSYLEFDSAFTDMKATFRILPNGTVNMAGLMNATHMPYTTNGMNMNGFLDVSTSGGVTTVSTNGSLTLPPYMAASWPYNASTVSVLADYSKQIGDLNLALNSTVVLPPETAYMQGVFPYQGFSGSQYPWNSSDFNLNLACSNGVANGELQATTSLPPNANSMFPFNTTLVFPFNATDFSFKADYLAGLFKGNATFHVISGFPLGDLTFDFEASRTQATLSGSVTVIYGTFEEMTFDESYVDSIIENIAALEGTGPNSLFNMTDGSVELSPASSITKTPLSVPPGVTVDFNLVLDGDPIALVAFELSQGSSQSLTYPGVFRLLNATVSSFNSASIELSYYRLQQTATLDVKFAGDVNRLVTTLFDFPQGTWPLVQNSIYMRPTLEVGDIILVKNLTDASEINAAPYPEGDVIVFVRDSENPYDIVVSRAIDKTLVNGTLYFQTKGDYNSWPDSEMISGDLVLGRVVERIPYVGNLFLAAGSPLGFMSRLREQNIQQLAMDVVSLVKTLNLQVAYTGGTGTFDLKLDSEFDVEGYREKILPKLLDLVDPSMKTLVTELSTQMYANVTTSHEMLTYENGIVEGQATATVEGDFTIQTNLLKNLYVYEFLNSSSSIYREPWLVINATWLDASNLTAKFVMVNDSEFFSFDGFQVSPPVDQIDAGSFRLSSFFNLVKSMSPYSAEMPVDRQRLTLELQCVGSGANILKMTLPPTMPLPDSMSEDETFMVWNNQSASILGNITFSLQGYIGISGKNPVIISSNGTVTAAVFDPSNNRINLTIEGQHGSAGFANVSIPTEVLNGPIESWTIIVGNTTIVYPDYQVVTTATHTYLYFTFNFSSPILIQIVGQTPKFPGDILLLLIAVTAIGVVIIGGIIVLRIRRKRQALHSASRQNTPSAG